MGRKLKVALFIEKCMVRNFELDIIEKIKALSGIEIVLIIDHLNPQLPESGILYKLYMKADSIINARNLNYTQLTQLYLSGIPKIDIISQKADGYDFLSENDIKNLKKINIDIILKFNDTLFKGAVLDIAQYGIWEFRYGRSAAGIRSACIQETFAGDDTLLAILQKLPGARCDGYIIDSYLAASNKLSVCVNQNSLSWKTRNLIPRNLERLSQNPESFILRKQQDICFYHDKKDHYPNMMAMLFGIGKLGYKNIINRIDRFFYKMQWSIYYAENEHEHPYQRDISKFIKIDTPKHLFWADPFVIDRGNKSYIFYEDFVYKTKKGHISVLEYDHDSKTLSEPVTVIDTEYHQSYPFIMEYEDEIYMIPEGSKDKDVKLYRATNFPYQWEVVRTFFTGKEAVDMTLFYYEHKWWLFVNMISSPGESLNEELYIFHCDDFRTDVWIPHMQNPVISSIQTSRPAGKIIEYKGTLYRPSQNSAKGYGYGTNFNRILVLTPEEYKEEFVTEITPDFINGIKAVHTYNSSEKLTVIDCLQKIRRFF